MIGAQCEFLTRSGWTQQPEDQKIATLVDHHVVWVDSKVKRDWGRLLHIASSPFLSYWASPDHPVPVMMIKGGAGKMGLSNLRVSKIFPAEKIYRKLQYQDAFTGEHIVASKGCLESNGHDPEYYLPIALAALDRGYVEDGIFYIDAKHEDALYQMETLIDYDTKYNDDSDDFLCFRYPDATDFTALLEMDYIQALYCFKTIEPLAYKNRKTSRAKAKYSGMNSDALQYALFMAGIPSERTAGQVEGQVKRPYISIRSKKHIDEMEGDRIDVGVENPVVRHRGRIVVLG